MVTRESILKKALETANYNLYCASANYLMTKPKQGMEHDHSEYTAEVELLKEWIAEFTILEQKMLKNTT